MLVFDALAGLLLARVTADHGGLGRFLRSFPGGPGFAFEPVEFEEFHLPRGVEVANG